MRGRGQLGRLDRRLLKLLHKDPGPEACEALASDFGVWAWDAGSAEHNIALHRVVMNELEENGGRARDSFYV